MGIREAADAESVGVAALRIEGERDGRELLVAVAVRVAVRPPMLDVAKVRAIEIEAEGDLRGQFLEAVTDAHGLIFGQFADDDDGGTRLRLDEADVAPAPSTVVVAEGKAFVRHEGRKVRG